MDDLEKIENEFDVKAANSTSKNARKARKDKKWF